MTYPETIDYLYTRLPMFTRIGEQAYKKDLGNTLELCKILGEPQEKFKSIHIAGTNGKGSVSHGMAAIFQASGYKTGLYTSPHLKDFRERIKINGKPCSESFVIEFTEMMQPHIESIQPSFFELTVAMAFEYFVREKVDIAIIETGLGGRLDSTNIIRPQLSVITNISFDHQHILGDTLEQIAFEKAGIIKPGIPVVIGRKQENTNTVFVNKSLQERSPLVFAEDRVLIRNFEIEKNGMRINYEEQGTAAELKTDLRGIFQVENIRTILSAVSVYEQYYPGLLKSDSIFKGLLQVIASTGFMGRWQLIREHPRVIVDVGHNEDGIRKVLHQLRYESYQRLHLVYGAVKDKDVGHILKLLPRDAICYFTEPPIPRKLPIQDLLKLADQAGLKGSAFDSPKQALESAIHQATEQDLVLVLGSFFVVAELI